MRVAVMCIGNELLMDEGVGPACSRYLLSRYEFPENVDVLDRAVMGMSVISDLRVYDYVLVLDAVDVPEARPGQVFSFAPTDIAPTPPGMTSLHEVRFADVLGSAELLGISCQGHCLGVQVENMSPSEFVIALTPRVAAALPLLAQAAVRHLRTVLGLEVRDRALEEDALRAGSAASGRRDFSRAGRSAAGCAGEQATCAAARADGVPAWRPALPDVYGEPDASVMTRYLCDGLRAVGALGVSGEVGEGLPAPAGETAAPQFARRGHAGVAEVVLPAADDAACGRARRIAERFGLEAVRDAACGRYRAYVSAATTDYDCDALIGACLEAVGEAAGDPTCTAPGGECRTDAGETAEAGGVAGLVD